MMRNRKVLILGVRKVLTIILFFGLMANSLKAQDEYLPITWNQLAGLQFEETYDEVSGGFYDKPVFGFPLKALDGKKIKISGYVIPMDVELNYYVVSSQPFSSCFFCGGAGPETVIELNLKDREKTFKNDERATFCGILKLNDGSFAQLPYSMESVEICD